MKTAYSFVQAILSHRSTAMALCLSGLVAGAPGCAPMDEAELGEELADVEVQDVIDTDEGNLGESTEALTSTGFVMSIPGGTIPAVDAAGNAYFAGAIQIPGKDRDINVRKYSPNGTLLFSVSFGGVLTEEVRDIAVDSSGNTYIVATTNSYGAPTILVAKLNAAGNSLLYYTRFGGRGDDQPRALALDSARNVYVTGYTTSPDFPVTAGAPQNVHRGMDAFVTKINATGTGIVYSTYLGGDSFDSGQDIAVDSLGYAYVVGQTQIPQNNGVRFPTTPGAFQVNHGGIHDGFVTALSPNGSSMYYSTLVGGSDNDMATSIAVDTTFNAYVTGYSYSSNFPTKSGAMRLSKSNPCETFVLKLNEAGTGAYFSTFTGNGSNDLSYVALGSGGKIYIAGGTSFPTLPVTANAFQKQFGGSLDATLMELDPYASSIRYATYLGGNGWDPSYGIGVDAYGNVYVAGATQSTNFPWYGVNQPPPSGSGGFLAKFIGP